MRAQSTNWYKLVQTGTITDWWLLDVREFELLFSTLTSQDQHAFC